MKKLLILFAIFTFNVGTAQEQVQDSTQATTLAETERLIDKYSDKVSTAFEEGVEKIAPTVKQGFEVAVRYQVAKGIADLLYIPLGVFFAWLFFKSMRTCYIIEANTKNNDPSDVGIGACIATCIGSGILGIISIISALFNTGDAIRRIIAPEWFAIKEIVEMF